MSFSDESSFVSALDRLTASGGNDCPELAFNGIIDAIEIGKPAITSPMFVLTDAGVKPGEGPKYTLDNALGVVMNNLIPVNFFYSTESGSCGTFQRHEAFVELVDETEGFAMQFNSSGEIMKMSEAMALALDGTTTILEGRLTTSRGRTLRSARDKTYTIPVDDTIETLLVTYIASMIPIAWNFEIPLACPSHEQKISPREEFGLSRDQRTAFGRSSSQLTLEHTLSRFNRPVPSTWTLITYSLMDRNWEENGTTM